MQFLVVRALLRLVVVDQLWQKIISDFYSMRGSSKSHLFFSRLCSMYLTLHLVQRLANVLLLNGCGTKLSWEGLSFFFSWYDVLFHYLEELKGIDFFSLVLLYRKYGLLPFIDNLVAVMAKALYYSYGEWLWVCEWNSARGGLWGDVSTQVFF